MDGQDHFRPRRNRPFNLSGIQVERGIIDIDIDRCCAWVGDRPTGGHERKRRGDDLIAGTDAQQKHGHVQSRGAAVEANRVLSAAKSRELRLKLSDIRPETKRALIKRPGNRGIDLLSERPHLGRQVKVWNTLIHSFFSKVKAR
jgi:hypothetical protein